MPKFRRVRKMNWALGAVTVKWLYIPVRRTGKVSLWDKIPRLSGKTW